MQMYEIEALIPNLYKKNKESWEQARLIAYVMAQVNSTKSLKPSDIISFSWDKEEIEGITTISDTDIQRLKDKAITYLNTHNND